MAKRARAKMLITGLVILGGACASPPSSLSPPPGPAPAKYPLRTKAGAFEPPGPEQRRAAIGSLDDLQGPQRRVFEEGHGFFEPVPEPDAGDWLDERAEVYQTFDRYRRRRKTHPGGARRSIYLVEIGDFDPEASPSVEALTIYTSAFFGMPVERLPPLSLHTLDVTARDNDGHMQLHAKEILERLRGLKPDDAFALAAVTMYDLYPDDDWNFVFGYADGGDQVGVFSFARFDPAFHGGERGPDYSRAMLERSAETLSHELGHMFGISHCTHYLCVMNGHNHAAEGARMPMHLCPVDLRKLQHSIGFDPIERYRRLMALDRELGLDDEAAWTERRLEYIEPPS